MNEPRIMIAGIGNIFFGDDAFGVEVLQRMSPRSLPEGVRAVDFGIRGLDLAYALLEDHDAVILVDAVKRGGAPGTLYVLEIGHECIPDGVEAMVDPHTLDPWSVLKMVKSLGGSPKRIYLVGCEPQPMDPDDMAMELSEPVRSAAAEAVRTIESLVDRIRSCAAIGNRTASRAP
jgi:hydrogenase maturation protease